LEAPAGEPVAENDLHGVNSANVKEGKEVKRISASRRKKETKRRAVRVTALFVFMVTKIYL